MMIILALLGYLTDHLKFRGRNAIAIVLSRIVIGPVLTAVFFKLIYFTSIPYTNVWLLCLTYAAPSAVLCIPLYFALKKKIPNLLSTYKEKNSMSQHLAA